MVVSRLGLQPAIRYMMIHVSIIILEHVQLNLGCHALEIRILERARRRVGLDRIRARTVTGNDACDKRPVTVGVLALARPPEPVAKRGVTVVHTRVVDVDINALAGQFKMILTLYVGHRAVGGGLGSEHLDTQTRPREVVGQSTWPMSLKSLHLGQTGQGCQFVGRHAGHELGSERCAILRQHLDTEPGQVLGRGRLAVREQHHV